MSTSKSHSFPSSLFLKLLLFLTLVQARTPTIPRPSNPYLDPKHDPYNPLRYIANNTLSAIVFALFLLIALVQTYWIKKWGAKWMSAMVIGEYTFAIGIAIRFGLHDNPESKGMYIAEYLFVVLSPVAFIAADYVLLGRLALYLKSEKHLLVHPKKITMVFITSDVITFLIQATGGSVSVASNDLNIVKLGSHIFLAGLALQLLSFFIFTSLYIIFLYKVYTSKTHQTLPPTETNKPWYSKWTMLATALFISCIGILVRSVYRTIELSEGFGGHLSTTESFFYALDTLPLFVAVVVYVPFWPGRFIRDDEGKEQGKEGRERDVEKSVNGESGSGSDASVN